MFNSDSPNVARTSRTTYSTAIPDMTSPATSGRHLSKFAKRPKMPPHTALGRILLVRRFACLIYWWASCSLFCQQSGKQSCSRQLPRRNLTKLLNVPPMYFSFTVTATAVAGGEKVGLQKTTNLIGLPTSSSVRFRFDLERPDHCLLHNDSSRCDCFPIYLKEDISTVSAFSMSACHQYSTLHLQRYLSSYPGRTGSQTGWRKHLWCQLNSSKTFTDIPYVPMGS